MATIPVGEDNPLTGSMGRGAAVEECRYDDLDRALVHALQIDARAPFRRIGEVLGVSDRTIARRYERLRDAHVLRVLGVSDPAAVNEVSWMVHLRAGPDVAGEIADALARRADTSWVNLCSGGTEIFAIAHGAGVQPLLVELLPRTRQVLDVQAGQILHVFYGGVREPYTKHGPLTAHQVAALVEHVPTVEASAAGIDALDRQILDVLSDDGRATVEYLVSLTNMSSTTVRRRLHDLRASGAVRFDVDLDHSVFGLPLTTMLRLGVAAEELETVGCRLAEHEQVAFAAATTGSTNVVVATTSEGVDSLYRYLTVELAGLPGVREVEAAPVLRIVKAAATYYGVRRGLEPAVRQGR